MVVEEAFGMARTPIVGGKKCGGLSSAPLPYGLFDRITLVASLMPVSTYDTEISVHCVRAYRSRLTIAIPMDYAKY
jgi:hypothetical protein